MPADLTKPFGESCCDGGACNDGMSAQSCGCDPGLKPTPWVCQYHKLEAKLKEGLRQHEDALMKEIYGQVKETP